MTHRKDIRGELITIVRILMGMSPPVMGDLPAPEQIKEPLLEKPAKKSGAKAAKK